MNKSKIIGNERGGVSVLIMSLLAMVFCSLVLSVCLDYILLYNKTNKLKNDLNAAVHAATLSIDKNMLSQGYIRLDTSTPGKSAKDMFYKYLRLNMNLDNMNKATFRSRLAPGTLVNVDELIYVDYEGGTIQNLSTKPTGCSYSAVSSTVTCTVTLNAGTSSHISRTVNQAVRGPSIVAIVDLIHDGFGIASNEPILLPAVQEVYFRKK